MVDSNIEEDKSYQKALEQRPSAFPMSDRDPLISIGDMDIVLFNASTRTGCRPDQG